MLNVIVPDWKAPKWIKAVTTTRLGGTSQGPYASLNLGDHVDDDPQQVNANRQRLISLLKLPHIPRWLNQTHSNHVASIKKEMLQIDQKIEADAVVTNELNVVCPVLTADCLPILLCDQEGKQVAAIHAGWRGLADDIIAETVKTFKHPSKLFAWLGPALGPNHFEVREDVFLRFPKQKHCFHAKGQGQWLFDIYAAAKDKLQQVGVRTVFGGHFCTYSDATRFYSYRRDGKQTGRMATLIWIDEEA